MIVGLGIDIVSIDRIAALLSKYGAHFEMRFFSELEVSRATRAEKAGYYAKRFAAKEAFLKAVGTGLVAGFSWREIQILNLPSGAPFIKLLHNSEQKFRSLCGNDTKIWLALSDEKSHAVASVILEN